MARRLPRSLPLSITFLLARAGAEIIGPHLLDGTNTPTLHRDIAQNQVSIEELLKPFAGKKTGLAFRVHADNDAKTTDGGVADAIVAALRESGLPADPAEAAAVLKESPVPLSITLHTICRSEVEAIDLDDNDYCFCQTACQCLDSGHGRGYYVATRRSITELPQEC